jgi:hypothetical protein
MVNKATLQKQIQLWSEKKISNWKISNWACSCLYNEEEYEDSCVEETIEMLSNVGADMDYCTTFSAEQYLEIAKCTSSEEIEELLENLDGLLDENLEDLFPAKEEFITMLDKTGWFEGMTDSEKEGYCENIEFQGLPNLEDIYFKNQEIFWLRLAQPSAVYNEMEDGNIFEESNFSFIEQLDLLKNVQSDDADGDDFDEVVSFEIMGQSFKIELDISLDPEEILQDFFAQLNKILSQFSWQLIYSDRFMDAGDLMFLVLIESGKLENGYKNGAVRAFGEEACEA